MKRTDTWTEEDLCRAIHAYYRELNLYVEGVRFAASADYTPHTDQPTGSHTITAQVEVSSVAPHVDER